MTKIRDSEMDTGGPIQSIEGCIKLVTAVIAPELRRQLKNRGRSNPIVDKKWLELAAMIIGRCPEEVKEAWQNRFRRNS